MCTGDKNSLKVRLYYHNLNNCLLCLLPIILNKYFGHGKDCGKNITFNNEKWVILYLESCVRCLVSSLRKPSAENK